MQLLSGGNLAVRVDAESRTSPGFGFDTGRWVCIQLTVGVSSTGAGSVELAIDGESVYSDSAIRTSDTEGLPRVQAGVVYGLTAGTQPVEVLVDEVVVTEGPAAPCDG